MTKTTPQFHPTQFDPNIAEWLREHDLPVDDLPNDSTQFYEGIIAKRRVCTGALQMFPPTALLRSIVVRSGEKGEGYGRALVEFLLEEARTRGVESVYLLTTTADCFFDEIGFIEVDRSDLPPPIRSSEQAASLCPDSAISMRYSLSSPDEGPS